MLPANAITYRPSLLKGEDPPPWVYGCLLHRLRGRQVVALTRPMNFASMLKSANDQKGLLGMAILR